MSFHHAPVTKGLMLACGGASLLAALFDIKYYLHLQLVPHLWRDRQYWRLLVHSLAFSSSGEVLVAELLFYNVAMDIERTFGSRKFASFVVVTIVFSTVLSFVALVLLHRLGLNFIPPGCYSLIFSILYQHYRIVPSAYHFRIFSVDVSSKVYPYILAAQLFFGQAPGSAVAGVIGILVGQLYRTDLLGLKSYRISPVVVRLSSRFLLPLIGSTKPPRRTSSIGDEPTPARRATATTTATVAAGLGIPTTLNRRAPGQGNAPADGAAPTGATDRPSMMSFMQELTGRGTPAGLRAPTEAEIAQVTSMFPNARREDIVGALQRSESTEAAVETLLSAQI